MQKHLVIVFALLSAFFIYFSQSQRSERSTLSLGQVPYQVSLERVLADSKVPVHFCDGIIIHPNWILASAHCFDSDNSTNFIIRYGTIYADEGGMTVTAELLLIHPNYHQNASVPAHDLALIRTKTLELKNSSLVSLAQVAPSQVTLNMMNITVQSDGSTLKNGQLWGLDYESSQPYYIGLYMSVATYASWFMIIIIILFVFCFKYNSLRMNPYNYYKANSSFSPSIHSIS